jgi:serine/threonine-protein kinase
MYEMLCGKLPFTEETAIRLLRSIAVAPPPPLPDSPDVPVALRALVMRLLSKEPAVRHASAASLAAELAQLLP